MDKMRKCHSNPFTVFDAEAELRRENRNAVSFYYHPSMESVAQAVSERCVKNEIMSDTGEPICTSPQVRINCLFFLLFFVDNNLFK